MSIGKVNPSKVLWLEIDIGDHFHGYVHNDDDDDDDIVNDYENLSLL